MKSGFAVFAVALALALPAAAQRGAAHSGSMGGSAAHGGFAGHGGGFSGHASSAGHPGFSGRGGFSRPGATRGYGGMVRPGPGRPPMAMHSGFRAPYRGTRATQYRPQYRSGYGAHRNGWDGGRDRRRNGWFGAFGNEYLGWAGYPYPFVIDQGLYDWGDSGAGGYDQAVSAPDSLPYTRDYSPDADGGSGYAAPVPYAAQAPAYAAQGPYSPATMAPGLPGAYPGPAATGTEEPLTLIFKDGRAPEKMQNYIMNAKALTDMDPQHFKRIPLDQIDVAATEEFNRARGVDFEVPGAGRE